jgi:hypothetical protein
VEATEKDFLDAKHSPKVPAVPDIKPGTPSEPLEGVGAVRMWGLPFDASEQDIGRFFAPFGMLEGSLRLGTNHLGQPTGEAVVQFETPEAAEQVCVEKYGQMIGQRWIGLESIGLDKYYKFGLVYDFSALS